ncbi:Peptidase A1 domain-containing protein [Fusarium sp. Ph1]|nr:Peptidase A1 domain-containing protein [Fusarium sp. Ph1]
MMHAFHYLAVLLIGSLPASASTLPHPDGYRHVNGSCSKSVAVPAVWNGFGYLFNITVGTPPQELTMLSDWTWMSLFVRSGRCLNQYDPSLCLGASGQTWFDERASTSFANTSLPQLSWPLTAFAPNFTVDYGTDDVCIGDLCSAGTVLQVSDFPYPGEGIPKVPFGGIFGMAPVTAGLNETFHPANYQAWKAERLGSRVGWNSCAALASSDPCLGGEAKLVFGGTDSSLYDNDTLRIYEIQNPDWLSDAFYPLTPPRENYWTTPLTGSWILGTSEEESRNFAVPFSGSNGSHVTPLAVLDEGSEGLGAPLSLNAYNWLVDQVRGTLASNDAIQEIHAQGSSGFNTVEQNWYTVSCDDIDSYPQLVYELNGHTNYTVPPQDYVTKLGDTSTCYLNVNVWKYGRTEDGNAKVALLGLAFLKRLYVVLDFETQSFGLAPLSM